MQISKMVLHCKTSPLDLSVDQMEEHKVLFSLIYDGGLRISEVINLQITDVDFDRKQLHIRQSKNKKDRYVPISSLTLKGLVAYLNTSNPTTYLLMAKLGSSRHWISSLIMEQNKNSVGHIVQHFLPKILYKKGLSKHQLRVLSAIAKCRTKALGGSVLVCQDCGEMHYVFHSCRNRNCPNCQGIDKELWVEDRKHELLPTRYYHVVFTIPSELRKLFAFNKKLMYNLLITTAWEVLSGFGENDKKLNAQMGAISILHTWDQKMNFHPHVHFIVPGGGINVF